MKKKYSNYLRKICFSAVFLISAGFVNAQTVLYDNGTLAGGSGLGGMETPGISGFGGAPVMMLAPPGTTLGAGHQILNNNRVAEDFTVSSTVQIDSIRFFSYQTSSTTTSTINDLRVRIFNGAPNAGGTILYGDTTTNRLFSTSFTGIYRVASTDTFGVARPIMSSSIRFSSPLVLNAGTYWIEWSQGGTLASGPWCILLNSQPNPVTGNALQYLGSVWQNLIETGSTLQMSLPFIVYGSCITTSSSQTFAECAGFSVTVGTNTYNTTGVYTDVLTNVAGCDSTVTTDLTINLPTSSSQTFAECAGFSVTVGTNTYNTTGIYTDILTNVAGCDSTVTTDLTINSVSDLAISTSGVIISANNIGATYQWLDCNNNNSILVNETGQSFTATTNGNFAVELTENGCVDTSACVAITTVGIIENSFGDELIVYPNPTSGNFSINLGSTYENAKIVIMDIYGKMIESKTMTQSKILKLSIKEPVGIYIVSIQAGKKSAIIRLVKE